MRHGAAGKGTEMFKAPQTGDRITGLTITYRDGMSYTFEMHATLGEGKAAHFLAGCAPSNIATVHLFTEDGMYTLFSLGVGTLYGADWPQ